MRQHAAQLVLLVSMTSVVEACRADALFLQWPAVGPDELLFLVVEMSDGAPTIRGPYVGSEQVLPPERLALEDEAALWTVVLDHAQLGRLSPALDYGRLTEVTIERGAESCLQGRVLADFERHPVGVDHARVQVLEDQAWIDAVLPEGWAVSIPILQENCWRSPAPTLRPFGSEAWLFGPEVQVGSVALSADPSFGEFEEVLVLDESRILAASGFGVHLLERGAPWSNAPARSFFGESFPRDEGEDTVWIDDIELDPTPREEGRRLLLAYPRQGDTTRSVIATMHWNDLTGFGASEVVYEGEENLARMTQDRFGRWFAIGERGVVVWGLFDNREAERQQIPRSGDLRGLLMTEQPFEPHLAIDGTRNLFFGNVTA